MTFPSELKAIPQWVVWRLEERDGKPTKVPYRANGDGMAAVNAPATWASAGDAFKRTKINGFSGLGFVVTREDPFCGIDLDHCRVSENAAILPWAMEVVHQLNSYTEITPSGEGLRIWVRASLPEGGNRKGDIEMYDHDRYFTATGQHLEGTPETIEDRQQEVAALHARLFPKPAEILQLPTSGLTAYDVIGKARAASNGPKFDRLMRGDASDYHSGSEADEALCCLLAFYTRDPGTIEQVVRMSGLWDEKWDRRDYRERTITKALEVVTEAYEPKGKIRESRPLKAVKPAGEGDPPPVLPDGVTQAGRARLYDLGAYRPDLEAAGTNWRIKDWLVEGQVHLFVGEEKKGKSTQQWHRIASVTTGTDYHGAPARKGRVLAITEMGPEVVKTLLDDDGIEVDWSLLRVVFVDEMPREDRLAAIGDAVQEWRPDLLTFDPLDECFGLDEAGIFNPTTTADGFQMLRQWTSLGVVVDATYHYNNQGKIANSYKFRSKPDHIFRIKGTEPGDVTYEYQGRLRAIPRKRRVKGDGDVGYEITVLLGGQVGRPAKTRELVLQILGDSTIALSLVEISKRAGVAYDAIKKAVTRGVKSQHFEHVEGGYRLVEEGDSGFQPSPGLVPSPLSDLSSKQASRDGDEIKTGVSSPSSGLSSKNGDETPHTLKGGDFVPFVPILNCPACGKSDYVPEGGARKCLLCGEVWVDA